VTSPNPAEDVAFVFTEETLAEVVQMEADQKFTGKYGAIIDDLLRQQARRGFAEVVMRNPETREEVLVRISSPIRPFLEIHTPFGPKRVYHSYREFYDRQRANPEFEVRRLRPGGERNRTTAGGRRLGPVPGQDSQSAVPNLLRPDREAVGPEEIMTSNEHTLEAITERLKGVASIPITDDTSDSSQHYGYRLGVGNNTLGTLWHCTDDRRHPDHNEYVQKGWDTADLYMNSHFASIDDEAAFAFLLNARQDIQMLLGLLGVQVELRGEDEDA
jgi:hypothetical protein